MHVVILASVVQQLMLNNTHTHVNRRSSHFGYNTLKIKRDSTSFKLTNGNRVRIQEVEARRWCEPHNLLTVNCVLTFEHDSFQRHCTMHSLSEGAPSRTPLKGSGASDVYLGL